MSEKFPTGLEGSENEIPPEAEEVISGGEVPSAMKEYAAEQEKMANMQFELLREFQNEERELFASVEADGTEKESSLKSRIKKGMMAIMAGVVLMTAMPAFAGELQKGGHSHDMQSIEQQIQKLQEEKLKLEQSERAQQQEQRTQELQGYVNNFHIKGLTLGEPEMKLRCGCEQYGIYLEGKHFGDVHSERFTFSPDEFIGDVKNVLKENGVFEQGAKEKEPSFYLDISTKAQVIMDAWGWRIYDGQIDIPGKKNLVNLNGDGKTESASIVAVGKDKIVISVTDKDGTVSKVEGVQGELLLEGLE